MTSYSLLILQMKALQSSRGFAWASFPSAGALDQELGFLPRSPVPLSLHGAPHLQCVSWWFGHPSS